MTFHKRLLLSTPILLASCCLGAPSARPKTTIGKTILAYYERGNSNAALQTFAGYISQMSADTYGIDVAGNISGSAPRSAIAFATAHNIPSYFAISNWGGTDFSPSIAHAVLNSPSAQQTAISGILKIVPARGYAGVNIDFESLNATDRVAFSNFIKHLSQRMHAAGYTVIVSVPAEQADNPSDGWIGAFDYKALGRSADLLQLMTYDEHGPWGKPGPVAGNDWVLRTVQFAVHVVPRKKLSLGLPAYGYDWNLTAKTGVQISWNKIPTLIASTQAKPTRDAISNAPYFDYTASDGSHHEVWYEDETSIATKARYAVAYHLVGVNMFALGFEDQKFWDAVLQGLKTQ